MTTLDINQPSTWRSLLAHWPNRLRQRWGEESNRLELAEGLDWRAAEMQAFNAVMAAEVDALETMPAQPVSASPGSVSPHRPVAPAQLVLGGPLSERLGAFAGEKAPVKKKGRRLKHDKNVANMFAPKNVPMKHFDTMYVEEAIAYAAAGGQSLHTHQIITDWNKAPVCFKREVKEGRDIAHLFDQNEERLRLTVISLGVNIVVVEHRGKPGQHVDLCAGPLRKALSICKVATDE